MDRHMAASLDHWLTTPPEEPDLPMPGDEFYPRCGDCGAFLMREPLPGRVDYETYMLRCHGRGPEADPIAQEMGWDTECELWYKDHAPHWSTYNVSEIVHRICKRCGHDNGEVVF